jgi:hypothetical protein
MKRDARGLDVSTDCDEVIAGIDRFTSDFLAARDDAAAIFDLATRHPDCALVQTYAAAMHLYSESTAQIDARARPLLARAVAVRGALTRREAALVDLVAAWVAGERLRAIALAEAMAVEWPRDIVVAKLAEFLFYEAPDYRRHLRFMRAIAPAHDRLSHFHAMYAFALELAACYGEAERAAERAVALDVHTPWAHHALAHLYLNQGRLAEGIRALEDFAPTWGAHARSIQCHNAWHLALLHLTNGDYGRAAAIGRERIWGVVPDSVFEQVDAIALLWRLDLAGAPADDLWPPIAGRVAALAGEQVFPFLSAHVAYALARAGRRDEVRAAIAALAAHADRQPGSARWLWRDIALPLVTACRAFAERAYGRCAALLEPIAGDLAVAGGSDAQSDLFRQTLLVALLESGRRADARALLQHRLGDRAPTPLEASWIARAG